MTSLSERLTRGSASSPSQVDHARRLVADWQLLADLAFADLTLWVPLQTGSWWCVAQVRPLTAPCDRFAYSFQTYSRCQCAVGSMKKLCVVLREA